jgi:hypothetical protein
MKFCKNWPYWLKGGVITATIGFFLVVIHLTIHSSVFFNHTEYPILLFFSYPGILLALALSSNFGCPLFWSDNNHFYCYPLENISAVIFSVVVYFILGMIIGWIVGKIKNR